MDESQYELYHYGVPGMKWGIRKGRANVAYVKGLRKLKKYEDKASKHERKAQKYAKRLEKYGRFGGYLLPHQGVMNDVNAFNSDKYSTHAYRARRLRKKKEKFQKKMDETFKGVNVNKLDLSELKKKRKYAEALLARKRGQI